MDIQRQPKLQFKGINIVQTNFNAIQQFNSEEKINLEVEAKLIKPTDEEHFQILMNVSVSVENYFDLGIVAIGNFDLSNDLQGESRQAFINTNAPAIMFPYLRAFITTFSANCGTTLPTITIPPHFFKGDLDTVALNN